MLAVILNLKLHRSRSEMDFQIFRQLLSIRQFMRTTLQFPQQQQQPVVMQKQILINTIKITDPDDETIQNECPICLKNYSIDVCFTTNCNHIYCTECLKKHMTTTTNANHCKCPLCRTEITSLESKQKNPPDEILGQKLITLNLTLTPTL